MNNLADAVAPVAVFFGIGWMIKIICDYKTRKHLIDKGLVDEKVKFLYGSGADAKALSNLKWGVVLIGIGLAAIFSYWWPDTFHEEGTIGLMFLFAGIGFLAYYFMAPKIGEHKRDSHVN
ncbi:MAG: DUF6249 domain-containing protein [bacterium]